MEATRLVTDIIEYLSDKAIQYLLYTILLIVFWLKFESTRLYSFFRLYADKPKLINNYIFTLMRQIYQNRIPFQIKNKGRRELFKDLLQLEIESIIELLSKFITVKIYNVDDNGNFSFLKFFWNIRNIDKQNLIMWLVSEYENNNYVLDLNQIEEIYRNFTVSKIEVAKYHNSIKDIPFHDLDDLENSEYVEGIRNEIRKLKAIMSVHLYSDMMRVYRVQIIKNLINQLQSEKYIYQIIFDILNTCFLPVFQNISETGHYFINEINGQFEKIRYRGFKLSKD